MFNRHLKTLLKQKEEECNRLQKELESASSVNRMSQRVIEKLFDKGIKWYDYKQLDERSQRAYYNNAQSALRNETLTNEVSTYVNELIQEIVKISGDGQHKDMLRYSINGVLCLMERLEDIPNPDVQEKSSVDDIHSMI